MRLLLAEDEVDMSRALTAVLKHSGYEVDAVYNGEEAVNAAFEHTYDAMIFDIMMPKKDGLTALSELRLSGIRTPVLFLTAKAEVDDRVKGLDAGADDYLTKPFAMTELLARIRSMTRRSNEYTPKVLSVGKVTLDTEQQELRSVNSIRLANKEAKLMEFLMLNPGKEFSTEQIMEKVWKDEDALDKEIVWVYISFLRNKLQSIAANLEITGEEGGSYMLVEK